MSLDDSSLDRGPGDSPQSDDSLDVEVARVLESYLAVVEAGQPADPRRLLEDHPHLADRLRACLRVLRVAEQAAQDVTDPPAAARGQASKPGSTVPHGSGTPLSSLSTLDFGPGEPPQVLLREPAEAGDAEPVLRPYSAAMGGNGGSVGRYQLQGEIARGGMGAILKGRDVDLGRELAIKVLLESHRGDADVVRRFVEEAQIGGQLQHPGIVPVYELGAFPDRRPYFAMKLVKGRTLSALLAEPETKNASQRPAGERSPQDVGGEGEAQQPRIQAESASPLESRLQAVPGPAKAGTPTPAGREFQSAGRGSPDPALCVTENLRPDHADLPRLLSIFEQVCQTMAYAHARGVIHRDLKPSNVMVGSFGEVQVMDWGLAKVLPQGGIADEARARPAVETVIVTVRSGSARSGSESQAGSVLGTPSYMAPEQARGEVGRIDGRTDVFGLGAILCEILTGQPPFVGSSREEIRAQAARGDLSEAVGRLETCGADAELIDLARSCLRPERNRRPRNAGEVAQRIRGYLAGVQERLKAAELARVEAQARAEEETKRRAVADELAREARARADEERKRRRLTVALAASVLVVAGLLGGGSAYLARQRMARLAATARVVTGALAEAERLRGQAQAADDDSPVKWFEAVAAATRARELLDQGEADPALRQQVNDVLAGLLREQAAAEKRAAEVEHDRKFLAELEAIRGNRSEHWEPKQTDTEYAAAFRAFGIDLDELDPEQAGKQIARRSAPVELASYIDDWAMQRRTSRAKKEGASWRRLLAAARAADPDPWRVALRDQIGRDDLEATRRLSGNEKDLAAQSPISLVLLANALVHQQDRRIAERVLMRARRTSPDDFWVNWYLGEVHFLGGSFDTPELAIRYFSAAIALRPRSASAHASLGGALAQQGNLDEGIAECREAIRLKPGSAEAHGNLGSALRKLGKLIDAESEYREVIRLRPGDAFAHNNLGVLRNLQGKLDAALPEFREAIRLQPEFAIAHANLGNALKELGKLEEAQDELRQAIRLKPDWPEAHNDLGAIFIERGRLDEALTEFHTAIRLKPDFAEAHSNLGGALAMQGKLGEAVAEFRSTIAIKPDYGAARFNFGKALVDQGKLNEAEAEFREAIRLNPNDSNVHLGLGDVLSGQGRPNEAITELRTAIRLKPDNVSAHNDLGAILCDDLNEYDRAIPEFQTALRLKPNHADARRNLGVAYLKQGKLNEAVAEWHEALRLNPESAKVHRYLAIAFARWGDFAAAVVELRKARDLAKNDPTLAGQIERELPTTERQASLAARLPAVLAGELRPAGAAEAREFANVCYYKKLQGSSARMWVEAFQGEPKLADEMQAQHRYNAACAAALAGSGQGKDDPPLDERTKARWRKQAIDWLKADLAAWSKILKDGPPQARLSISKTLQHWKADPDLAGLRDGEALKRLPEAEQAACRALWGEVDALLAKARGTGKP